MKILHLSSERSWRGGEQQLAYLIEHSLSQNVEIVVCARKGSALSTWCYDNEVKLYELGFVNGIDIFTARNVKNIARLEKADVVHAHSGKSHSIGYLALLMGMDASLLVHRRVVLPLKSFGFSLAKFKHRKVHAIIAVSKTIKTLFEKKISHHTSIHVVYDGIDYSRFLSTAPTGFLHDEFDIQHSKLLIANISAIYPQKDLETFLKSAQIVLSQRSDCHFLVIGDGNSSKSLKGMAEKMGIEKNISFTGFRKDVPAILREIDIIVVTAKTEGLGTTIIDAMHNAIPIVASRSGGIPELLSNGSEGFLCEVGNAAEFAMNISELLNNKILRNEMGKLGMLRSRSFSKEKMGNGVINVYKAII